MFWTRNRLGKPPLISSGTLSLYLSKIRSPEHFVPYGQKPPGLRHGFFNLFCWLCHIYTPTYGARSFLYAMGCAVQDSFRGEKAAGGKHEVPFSARLQEMTTIGNTHMHQAMALSKWQGLFFDEAPPSKCGVSQEYLEVICLRINEQWNPQSEMNWKVKVFLGKSGFFRGERYITKNCCTTRQG